MLQEKLSTADQPTLHFHQAKHDGVRNDFQDHPGDTIGMRLCRAVHWTGSLSPRSRFCRLHAHIPTRTFPTSLAHLPAAFTDTAWAKTRKQHTKRRWQSTRVLTMMKKTKHPSGRDSGMPLLADPIGTRSCVFLWPTRIPVPKLGNRRTETSSIGAVKEW